MAAVHAPVVVTDGVEVVEEVVGQGAVGLLPGGGPGSQVARALAALDHVGRHVQAGRGEAHQRGELVAPLAHLPEALEVQDEDVGQCPQAHLHHALLQLLAVGALPRVVRRQLEDTETHTHTEMNKTESKHTQT